MYIKSQTSKDLFVKFKKLKLDQNVFNCTSSLNVQAFKIRIRWYFRNVP